MNFRDENNWIYGPVIFDIISCNKYFKKKDKV
jgi:hypothetical protein